MVCRGTPNVPRPVRRPPGPHKELRSRALDGDPVWSRLWHLHVFWAVAFVKIVALTKATGIFWASRRRYCRIADKLFGGTREQKTCDRLQQMAEASAAKARKVRAERLARRSRNEQFIAALDQ